MINVVDKTLTGVTHVTQKAAGTLTGVSQATQRVIDNRRIARSTIPDRMYLAELFHWRIFSKVDFDSVIEYLRTNNILQCNNLYTLQTLSRELIPLMTYEALRRRNPKLILGLYALTGKLCMRRKRGLLCYIDLASGRAKKICKFEDFLEYVDIPDSLQSDSLWIPTDVVFPKLRHTVALKNAQPIEAVPTVRRYMTELPTLSTPAHSQNGETSIFASEEINHVEVFLSEYQALNEEQSYDADKAFDCLMFALLQKADLAAPHEDINAYVQGVSKLMESLGVTNFVDALQHTSQDVMGSFRRLYNLQEGDGASNDMFKMALFSMWQTQTSKAISDEPSQDYLDLRRRLYEIRKHQAEEAAAAAEEQETQERLSELSQTMKTPMAAEDIIL